MPTEFTTLVSIASGIMAIVALAKLINAPLDKIKQHDEDIKELKKQNTKQGEFEKVILNSLQAITNHMIDGNGIDRLKASRDELSRSINEIATK
jgi:hypothetical protein